MTKRYKILQKKLQELESQLATILSFPPEIPVPKIIVKDFEQRLGFVRSFLSAEIASRPSKPRHLTHISRRLDQLGTLFRDKHENDDALSAFGIDDDGASACSCTESCLNDDGDAASEPGSPAHSEQDIAFDGGGEEEPAMVDETASMGEDVEFSDCLVAEIGDGDGDRKERLRQGRWLSWGVDRRIVFALGLVGFVVVVMLLGWFGYGDHDHRFENLLTPT